jgi:hypothetical protein
MLAQIRRPLLALVVASILASLILALRPAPAPAATTPAPISRTRTVVPMVFPVVSGATFSDTYLSCRSGCSRPHLGQDLMAPKMRLLVATFDGTITYMKTTTSSSGNYVSLRSASGWTVTYMHMNNDTPGTDNGRGSASWAFAPGIRVGARVYAGQWLGWLGDSGNAEASSPHTHFELRKGDAWSGTVYNAYPSLRAALKLTRPRVGGPHPDGVLVQGGPGWTTWLIEGGRRRKVLPDILAANGWSAGQVLQVQPSEVNAYPGGTNVGLRDGFVRDQAGQAWVISGGRRVAVADSALAGLGAGATTPTVTPPALNTAPLATDQSLPAATRAGALVKATGTGVVWLVIGAGTRQHVGDAVTLASWGFGAADVVEVSPSALAGLAVAAPLKLRDGTLFRSPTGAVYLVSGGKRRWIPSAQVLDGFGYPRGAIVTAGAPAVALLPEGPRLP